MWHEILFGGEGDMCGLWEPVFAAVTLFLFYQGEYALAFLVALYSTVGSIVLPSLTRPKSLPRKKKDFYNVDDWL